MRSKGVFMCLRGSVESLLSLVDASGRGMRSPGRGGHPRDGALQLFPLPLSAPNKWRSNGVNSRLKSVATSPPHLGELSSYPCTPPTTRRTTTMRARWPCGPFSVGSFTVGCQGLACCVGGLADTPILLLHAACRKGVIRNPRPS